MNEGSDRTQRGGLRAAAERPDPLLFSSAFDDLGVDPSRLVAWSARAAAIGASALPPDHGTALLRSLWSRDKYMGRLGVAAIGRLERFIDFAMVAAGRNVIEQDEHGNFMMVLLSGSVAVDRRQPWGELMRMAEARPGDILGEMSLLDSGMRFARCTTLTHCEIGVLDAEALDGMMATDPELAASLIALLARRLSLRLRTVGARVSDRKTF
ncbi:cyclic nucleotide-binding domain-containing protein [Caenimonas terrae]|uniref:Cyclic nucleotide-binding domain-containing protein n=1 Tax=Caenimonas terrae TaxID=696074 RepID=A0ABW0NBB7_9BURK